MGNEGQQQSCPPAQGENSGRGLGTGGHCDYKNKSVLSLIYLANLKEAHYKVDNCS